MTSLWWIRRDLRLTDNAALHASLEAGSVIPIFILDPAFASTPSRRMEEVVFFFITNILVTFGMTLLLANVSVERFAGIKEQVQAWKAKRALHPGQR